VNPGLADEQLAAIDELVTLAYELGVPVWLRGGWAMDFFLGRLTRDHADIDWFALAEDGQQLADGLISHGFEDSRIASPAHESRACQALLKASAFGNAWPSSTR